MLTSKKLMSLKQRALRKRVWFKVLDRAERGIIELSIRVVKKVRSHTLKEMLMIISEKLMDAIESRVAKLTETIGRPLAQKIATFASSWGNRGAPRWAENPSFIKYLTIMEMWTHR